MSTTNQEQQETGENKLREYSCKRCGHVYGTYSALKSHTFISHELPDVEREELRKLGLVNHKATGAGQYYRSHHANALERRMRLRLQGRSRKRKKDNKNSRRQHPSNEEQVKVAETISIRLIRQRASS